MAVCQTQEFWHTAFSVCMCGLTGLVLLSGINLFGWSGVKHADGFVED